MGYRFLGGRGVFPTAYCVRGDAHGRWPRRGRDGAATVGRDGAERSLLGVSARRCAVGGRTPWIRKFPAYFDMMEIRSSARVIGAESKVRGLHKQAPARRKYHPRGERT